MIIKSDVISLFITYMCNFDCDNCFTHCSKTQAPSHELLKLERLEYFIKDSIDCKKRYKNISLFGGEPTLHPQFNEICAMLKFNDKITKMFTIESNGYLPKTKEKLQYASSLGFILANSNKDIGLLHKTEKWEYHPVDVAPIDVGIEPPEDGCAFYHSDSCGGMGYDNNGYWVCAQPATTSRIFGYDATCQSIKDLNEENVRKAYKEYCKYCALALPIQIPACGTRHEVNISNIDIVTNCPTKRVINPTMSKSYVEAYKSYLERNSK